MSINLTVPSNTETPELKPRITVVGVGGAGGNAVDNMIRRELEGVDFIVANTDAQALVQSRAERRVQLGTHLTQGLGAGAQPEIGKAAAEEALEHLLEDLDDVHMAFIAAGMGGGTGTGAAPVIARAAREAGILTVGVVTKPFQFEGTHRMRLAEAGIEELEQFVDTLIIIPNQNLFRVANEHTTFSDAFAMADEVLYSGVRGVTDLIVMPGLINLDFADIRSVMREMGKAMMGTGEAEGERRALDAAEAAIANPLLEDTSMKGAKGVLINITGGEDITLFEVDEAATRIRAEVDQEAHIIVGSAFDKDLQGQMRVSVVATGIDADAAQLPQPTMLNVTEAVSRPLTPAVNTVAAPLIDDPVSEVVAEEKPAEPPIASTAEATLESTMEPVEEPVVEAAPEPVADEAGEAPTDIADPEPAEEAAAATEAKPIAEKPSEPAMEPAPEPMVPVAATPSTDTADAFIPPQPMEAKEPAVAEAPEPFAAAAMTNGAAETAPAEAEAPQSSRPSLFERVTRTGRAAMGLASSAPSPEPAPSLHQVTESKGLSARKETVATVLPGPDTPPVAAVAEPQPAQVEIAELAVEPAPKVQEAEDDLLDIPAFLRRQAN